MTTNHSTLFDFSQADSVKLWRAIDDRVMGGVSISELISINIDDQRVALFRGELSLANNGGFCSVRSDLQQSIRADSQHLWLECRDNMPQAATTYYLNVRTSDTFDGMSYRTSFSPTNTFIRYEFTRSEFVPVFRGRDVPDAPPLVFENIRQIGLMLADAQVGPFELIIRAIGVF
jgi:monofunctional biosynthetic peptidoglycan transglycosylase